MWFLGDGPKKPHSEPHLAVASSIMHPLLGSPRGSFKGELTNPLIFLPSTGSVLFLLLERGWTQYLLPENRIQQTSWDITSKIRV